jgi:ketosteroid isomerase-like protein
MRRRLAAVLITTTLLACAAAPAAHHHGSPGAATPDTVHDAAAHAAHDAAAVVAVMNRFFDAMRAQDTAALRSLSVPDLRIFVPGAANGEPTLRVSTIDQFILSIAAATETLDERAIHPEVRMDGNLATIWTYYHFLRGDRFSHCGFDAFHFARTADGWRIIGLAYTTRQHDCS